jgi:hypothetical protein
MTSVEVLDLLAKLDWQSKLKDVFKQANDIFKERTRRRTMNYDWWLPLLSNTLGLSLEHQIYNRSIFVKGIHWPITVQFCQSMRQNHSTFSLIVSFPPAFAVSFIFSTNMSQSLFEASCMSLNVVFSGIEYSSVKGMPGCNISSSSNPPTRISL